VSRYLLVVVLAVVGIVAVTAEAQAGPWRWLKRHVLAPLSPKPAEPAAQPTASVRLSLRIGPWDTAGTSPSSARVVWSFEPQQLTGTAGKVTAFAIDRDYKGFPELVGPKKYYQFCNEPVGNLATGTWKVRVTTAGWTTEGIVTLNGGNNLANFTQGRHGVTQGPTYPGD
jgi:hypothetical protein